MSGPEPFRSLFDDAAVFPPGNLPLPDAVAAHREHTAAAYSGFLGPFVIAAADLSALAAVTGESQAPWLHLAVTSPIDALPSALEAAAGIGAVRVACVEVTVPSGITAAGIVDTLRREVPVGTAVFVELPRDGRRAAMAAELSGSGIGAKLRTGGIRQELYPGEQELAEAVSTLVSHRVPFKATAGLHHALRNTDPLTGFEQHGFLNLLTATNAACSGADADAVRSILALRDPARIAEVNSSVGSTTRSLFRSFGTCDILGPLRELAALNLIPAHMLVKGVK